MYSAHSRQVSARVLSARRMWSCSGSHSCVHGLVPPTVVFKSEAVMISGAMHPPSRLTSWAQDASVIPQAHS